MEFPKPTHRANIKFKKIYKLNFNLLSDEKLSVIKRYGVWGMKSFFREKI